MASFRLSGQKSNQPGIAGFTLVEILVVLSVLAIVTSIALVYMPSSRNEINLRGQASAVMMQLIHTRDQAIRTHQDALFRINLSQGKFWTEDQSAAVTMIGKLPQDVAVELHTAARETINKDISGIRFFPDGSSTGGYIKLIGKKSSTRILVNWLTGKVEIENEKP